MRRSVSTLRAKKFAIIWAICGQNNGARQFVCLRVEPGLAARPPHRPVRADCPHTVLQMDGFARLGRQPTTWAKTAASVATVGCSAPMSTRLRRARIGGEATDTIRVQPRNGTAAIRLCYLECHSRCSARVVSDINPPIVWGSARSRSPGNSPALRAARA